MKWLKTMTIDELEEGLKTATLSDIIDYIRGAHVDSFDEYYEGDYTHAKVWYDSLTYDLIHEFDEYNVLTEKEYEIIENYLKSLDLEEIAKETFLIAAQEEEDRRRYEQDHWNIQWRKP